MALRLVGVSQRYGDQQVLDGVTLHVRPGDCYGFLGHNGAGKTTAMRIALGLVRPDAGRVLVDGFDAAAHPLEARARTGALIEVTGFHAQLSGRRNLVLLGRLQGLRGAEAEAEAARVLEAVGLAHAAEKAAGAYSQGMRQRLGIAQAILGRPKLVLLDEPTNGLDPEGIEEIRRLLRRLTRDEGTTVLLSSHQLHELSGVCNRIGILRQGRLLVEDETTRLVASRAGRHVVRTGDDAAASRVLAGLGLSPRPADGGGVEVTLGARPPAEVSRALVVAGLDLVSLAPRETSLEEIYLEFTRGTRTDLAPDAAPPAPAPPVGRLAAPGPVRRTAAYDVRRWLASPSVPVAFAAPALAAVLGVVSLKASDAASASSVAGRTLASATKHTAFTATGLALSWAVPFLAFVAAATAALTLAGEFGTGTLRNVALRPVGRARMTLGKAASSLGAAAAGYALVIGAALAAAAVLFDFGDLVELLVTGQAFPIEGYAAKDLWPVLWASVARQAPAVLAMAGIGLAVGAWARTGAAAVAGVVAAFFALLAGQGVAGPSAGPWFPTWYLPQVSVAAPSQYLYDVSTGVSNASPPEARAATVPLLWTAAAVAVACWKMRRRTIP